MKVTLNLTTFEEAATPDAVGRAVFELLRETIHTIELDVTVDSWSAQESFHG